MTKKTLIVTTTQDVTPFTDEYIDETIVKLIRQTADACGSTVEIKVVKEHTEDSPADVAERLLRSALSEVRESDERPRD